MKDRKNSFTPPIKFNMPSFLLGVIISVAVATSIVAADAGVNDNMDSPLITVANWLGIGNESKTPDKDKFDTASLVEKVNYLEDQLSNISENLPQESESAGSDFALGTTYHMGDYCIQGGQLYQCVVATSSTSWIDSEWMAVTGTSMVKSIQSGTDSGNKTITLGHAVNPNKTIILLNGGSALAAYSGNDPAVDNGCYVSSKTSNSFTVAGAYHMHYFNGNPASAYVTYSWQGIEFY